MARLEYEAICPRCGKIHKGKRREGKDVLLEFICKGTVRSGHPCGQLFSVKFFDEESAIEQSKRRWMEGHGDDWTDFKLRLR
jgi:hypothetical protein